MDTAYTAVIERDRQQLLGNLQHDIKTARSLQGRRCRHHRNDNQHDINRWFTWLKVEDEDQNDQTDTA